MIELLDPTRCDVDEFLWNLAYSENDSTSNHGNRWREALGPRLSARVAEGDRSTLTASNWTHLRSALRIARGAYLEPLLDLEPQWFTGRVEMGRLGELRLIRHAPFRAAAPSLLLGEFVDALDAGRETPGDRFAERYRRLRPNFDPAKARGIPAAVATSLKGPFTEIDGLTRMSLLVSRLRHGGSVPTSIPLIVGVSDRFPEWPWV